MKPAFPALSCRPRAGAFAVRNASGPPSQPRPGPRPNIVYILADDLGYGDLGCYNKDSKIPTPNLDRLAAEGMRFTDAHAPTSVCTPTRYALLTGRYSWRSRLKHDVLGPWGATLIAADRLTVPALLKQHGYATTCIGKWHLGWSWPTKDGQPPRSGPDRLSNVDFTKPIADGPTTRGFDSYFGVDLPNYPPYCYHRKRPHRRHPDRTQPARTQSPRTDGAGLELGGDHARDHAPGCALYRRMRPAPSPRTPFFLYFPLTAPHYPVDPRGRVPRARAGRANTATSWSRSTGPSARYSMRCSAAAWPTTPW